ncbi:HEPN domain-containing protein [Burkholderia gladioli]|uniref:HEPN domain-containing protein n=1 Tax=Burkholderia gladioli TaxID=28095 RepID=UPI00163EB246|nr:HEPN domain-containing protein [Burkholderia gladioli]
MATKIKKSIAEHAKSHWDCDGKERISLLLFVQRARELVLHTSSLMVKRKSASSFSIVQQILALLRQHKRAPHTSTDTNVAFLLEEFDDAIKADEVARALVGDRLAFLHQTFGSGDINQKLEVSEFILSRLAQREHFALCAAGIKQIIASDGKEKDRLIALTESFISGVRDAGYPTQTIYHLLNVSFLNKKKEKQTSSAMLEQFFSYFDLVRHRYNVWFGASGIYVKNKSVFKSIDASYMDASSEEARVFMGNLSVSARRFFGEKSIDGFLIFENIVALDPQSARQQAERQIRLLDDLLRFSSHRTPFKLNNAALVKRADKDDQFVHSNRPRPAVLRMPHDSDDGSSDLGDIAQMFQLTSPSSMQRFLRAVELHGTALSTTEEESQLLNLWIAFETLFVTGAGGSKIREVLDRVLSYVASCWIGYELQELWSETLMRHKEEWDEAIAPCESLRALEGSTAFIAAIALPKYKNEMTAFLKELDENPILRHKIFRCICWAQNSKKILEHLDDIRTRIEADINRIYRYRNQLVHVGEAVGDLGDVVQSAHHYLDIVLNLLTMMLGRPGGPRTIEQANMEVKLMEGTHRKLLETNAKEETAHDDATFLVSLTGRALLQ